MQLRPRRVPPLCHTCQSRALEHLDGCYVAGSNDFQDCEGALAKLQACKEITAALDASIVGVGKVTIRFVDLPDSEVLEKMSEGGKRILFEAHLEFACGRYAYRIRLQAGVA